LVEKAKDVERRRKAEQDQLLDPDKAKQIQHETPGIASSCKTGRFTVTDEAEAYSDLAEAQRNRPIPQFDQYGSPSPPPSQQSQSQSQQQKQKDDIPAPDDMKRLESQVGRFSVRDD
jgi:hypothetical protein